MLQQQPAQAGVAQGRVLLRRGGEEGIPHVPHPLHQRADVHPGHRHGEEPHIAAHRVPPADGLGEGEERIALVEAELVEGGARRAGGEDALCRALRAVAPLQVLAQHPEGNPRLQGLKVLGDAVDVDGLISVQLPQSAGHLAGGDGVARPQNGGAPLRPQGLDGGPGRLVGAADSDDHEGVGVGPHPRRLLQQEVHPLGPGRLVHTVPAQVVPVPLLSRRRLGQQGRGGAHLLLQRAGGQHRPRVGKGQGDAVHAQPSLA